MYIYVKDFYPSISKNTLLEALGLAKNYCAISKDKINTVVHCCKSVLIYNNCGWSKKNMGDSFDIQQGSFHGAEVCELVGLLILFARLPLYLETWKNLEFDNLKQKKYMEKPGIFNKKLGKAGNFLSLSYNKLIKKIELKYL